MLNFCTLFDSNYSAKGLAMYLSLLKVCPDFHLYIFSFDNTLLSVLKGMKLDKCTIISLKEIENEALLSVKEQRSKAEYCWTSTPFTIEYCIDTFALDHCTYLDADLRFYSNPKVLIDELGTMDVLITEHRYTEKYDLTLTSGKYCVQFLTFRNTKNGRSVLSDWKNKCLEWCFAYYEEGKFGDQMYLDDWTKRFDGIHELQNLGAGCAPWNMQQYFFYQNGSGQIWLKELSSEKTNQLIFFHFHDVKSFRKGWLYEFFFQGYDLDNNTKKLLYIPYCKVLRQNSKALKGIFKSIDGLATVSISLNWYKYLKTIRKRFLYKNNKYYYWLSYGKNY